MAGSAGNITAVRGLVCVPRRGDTAELALIGAPTYSGSVVAASA